jgi:hypothetical protein
MTHVPELSRKPVRESGEGAGRWESYLSAIINGDWLKSGEGSARPRPPEIRSTIDGDHDRSNQGHKGPHQLSITTTV